MCCTFGDLTDVQWWRELQLPVRTVIGRDGRLHRDTPEWLSGDAAATAYAELAGKTTFSAREAMVGAAARVRRPRGRAHADDRGWRTSTRRATSRSRSSRPGSGTSATAAATPRCASEMVARGAEIDWIPTHMQHRYDNWVERPQRRLADLAPALLRHPVPGLVPARRRRRARLRPPAPPERGRAAGRPVDPGAPGLRRGPARQAGRLRRRPRRDGHLGHLVADAPDRRRLGARRRPAGSGSSPTDLCTHAHDIIRTWLFSRVVRAHYENHARPVVARADLRLHRRPRPQEDVEVQGQRRRPDRHPRQVRRRRRPLARRDRPARASTRRSTSRR